MKKVTQKSMFDLQTHVHKKNAETLAMLIRQYVDKAQYVVISHNDGVISEADTLYGVSMKENGESKIVGLKL